MLQIGRQIITDFFSFNDLRQYLARSRAEREQARLDREEQKEEKRAYSRWLMAQNARHIREMEQLHASRYSLDSTWHQKNKKVIKADEFVDRNECVICLENFEVLEEVVQLVCHKTHMFHTGCWKKWSQVHDSCPLCRQGLKPGVNSNG